MIRLSTTHAAFEADFRALVEPLGRTLEQRTTLYGRAAAAA